MSGWDLEKLWTRDVVVTGRAFEAMHHAHHKEIMGNARAQGR